MSTLKSTQHDTRFLSIKNPSIYISIILAGLFFLSLIKQFGYIYVGPFAIMTWISFFMCIIAPVLFGGLFIKLQPKWDARISAARADADKEV